MQILQSLQFSSRRRLPVIQQTQAAECGLACIAMVANFYGHNIDMITLRQRFTTSLKGATLTDIMQVASRLELRSRALRLDIDELGKLQTPCILHWEMNHFVVLKKVSGNKLKIHDPAFGLRTLTLEEASESFTGVALELYPSANFKPIDEKKSISMIQLIGSVSGIKSAFMQILILSIALEAFGILSPFYMQWVMDQVLVSADYDLLTLLGIGFIVVMILQNAVSAIRSWVTTWFSCLLSVQWTANVFTHLLGLPMKYFEERHVGDIISRFDSLGTIQSTLTNRFISTVLDGVMAVITLGMLFTYNGMLTWYVIGQFVIYALIRFIAYRPFRQANEDQIITAARAQSQLLESIRGVQAVKLNNKQDVRQASYSNAMVDAANKGIVIQRLSIGFSTLQGVISGVGRILLVWLAARQVLEGNFSAGMLVAFVSFADQFTSRSAGLINAVIDFRMLKLHGERLADIVLTQREEEEVKQPAQPLLVAEANEERVISVENLGFRYSEMEPWVIHNCSFDIKSGESVAIIGASGQGKTTLAKLLLGLLSPGKGAIKFFNRDISRGKMHDHRERLGCVMQDDILFAGSIAENISFFDANVSHERIEAAAKLAQLHDEVMAMPMGYMSLVGDMGSSLSGGQKQRVLIARALYRKPEILVMDEASSNLDVRCEMLINQAIKNMSITRVIIAHRPETIRSADRVICLQSGSILEIPKPQLENLLMSK